MLVAREKEIRVCGGRGGQRERERANFINMY